MFVKATIPAPLRWWPMNIFWLIGVIVVVLADLGFLGLR
jgi:hypothetical protein